MTKKIPIVFLLFMLLFSCNSAKTANDEKSKKEEFASLLIKFHRDDFKEDIFNKVYYLEGVYKTKKDFELIKLTDWYRAPGFIKIRDNGQITFKIQSLPGKDYVEYGNMIKGDNYDAILIKENGKIYLYSGGYESTLIYGFEFSRKYSIQKYPVRIDEQNNIYIQYKSDACLVYKPVK